MIYKQYKNFEDLYKNLNRDIILNPDQYVIGTSGNSALLPYLILESESAEVGDSVKKAYKNISKFQVLVNKYLDIEKFKDFLEKSKKCSATSLTFYFNSNKKPEVHRYKNGGCILNFVLRRLKRNEPWQEITIYYRTTQLNRAFAFDLIFFNKIIELLPNCNFKTIRMAIVSPYFDMLEACHQLDIFDIDYNNLDLNSLIQKNIFNTRQKVLTKVTGNYVYHKYQRIAREILKGLPNKPINTDNLKLF